MGCGAGQKALATYTAPNKVVAVRNGECLDSSLRRSTASSSSASVPRRRSATRPGQPEETVRSGGWPLRGRGSEGGAGREGGEKAGRSGQPDVLDERLWSVMGQLRSNTRPACRRLGVELKGLLDTRSKAEEGVGVPLFAAPRLEGTRLLQWDGWLPGPPDSPYFGGVFQLALDFPEAYPLKPPQVKFVTPCYHPNVGAKSGDICLNILKQEWNPLLTVSTLLLCLSALLSQPQPADPLNQEAARLLLERPGEFDLVARQWTERYALRRVPGIQL